jgi:hypothetical protein
MDQFSAVNPNCECLGRVHIEPANCRLAGVAIARHTLRHMSQINELRGEIGAIGYQGGLEDRQNRAKSRHILRMLE